MARTNDEVAARRKARERVTAMQEERRKRDERIEKGVTEALVSEKNVTKAREVVSAAEKALSEAISAHDARMARIVDAFKSDKVPVPDIAQLLGLSASEVRKLGRLKDKPAMHPDDAPPPYPPLSGEQKPATD